jgi:CDP-diacylglycerol pyrophosphatase
MSKYLKIAIVLLVIIALIGGAIYRQTATNNKPDSLKSIVQDLHESLTPSLHKPKAQ